MAKRSLLLVDGDARSLRVLEVSLKKAGFTVTTAATGEDAFAIVEASPPDLIISNTALEGIDGFEFCQRLKDHEDDSLASIPFIFLTDQHSIEHKIRGLELGVDEYLTKPIYIKEILTRVKILLQKRDRVSLEARKGDSTRFTGKLADMGVVDLIQTIEVSSKSGVSHFTSGGQRASLYFRSGRVIDAELGTLQGADAIYRLLTWSDGDFEVLFRSVRRRDVIALSSQALLMEGMRRLDEWGRLLEQLPPLSSRFEVVYPELAERLSELPDELNELLKLFDGRRSLMDIIDQTPQGDLESLELIAKLFFEGLIVEADLEVPAGESWPPPVEDEPIELPPPLLRDEPDGELEHEAGDDMLDIELSEAVLASDAEEAEEPARSKRAPSLVDVAIDAVAPIHPELDSLPQLSKPAAPEPDAPPVPPTSSQDAAPLSEPGAEPDPVPDRPAERGSERPASDTLPAALFGASWDDEQVHDSDSEPAASADEREIARLETERRTLQMIPTLVEKVRHFGERTESTPLPEVSRPHASSGRARTVRDSAVTEPIPPADNAVAPPDPDLDADTRAAAEALAIARDVDAAMLEMQADFVSRPPEPSDEPVAGAGAQLEVLAEDDDDEYYDDYYDEEEGVTPVHRPPPKEPPRLEVVGDDDDLEVDDSSFETEGPSPPLDPLPPSYQHSGPIDSPHIVSSAGQEVATAAGAISHSSSTRVRDEKGRDSVEIDDAFREPDEPTFEEPLSGRNRRSSSPPIPRPPRVGRSPFPVIVGVVLTATLIGVIFLLRYRGAADTADVNAGHPDVSEVGLAVQNERPSTAIDAPVVADASVASPSPDAAAEDFVEIIDAGPPRPLADAALDPAAQRRVRARDLLRDAQRSIRRGRLDEALQQVQESIELRPTGRALATKASLMLRLKNREAAIRAADESLALSPRSASAWLTKGRAHYELAQYGEARTAFERYLELRPDGKTSDEVRMILERP